MRDSRKKAEQTAPLRFAGMRVRAGLLRRWIAFRLRRLLTALVILAMASWATPSPAMGRRPPAGFESANSSEVNGKEAPTGTAKAAEGGENNGGTGPAESAVTQAAGDRNAALLERLREIDERRRALAKLSAHVEHAIASAEDLLRRHRDWSARADGWHARLSAYREEHDRLRQRAEGLIQRLTDVARERGSLEKRTPARQKAKGKHKTREEHPPASVEPALVAELQACQATATQLREQMADLEREGLELSAEEIALAREMAAVRQSIAQVIARAAAMLVPEPE